MSSMPMHPTQFQSGQSRSHSLYSSSQASASSSSLADQPSDHESYSSYGSTRSARSGPGPSSTSSGFPCPNCGKVFARDDLLRRHLAREARALSQPSFDRQKSCYECARSKARCDLEVPTCGRCRARGKQCTYAPRSGNPNVRKARTAGLMTTSALDGSGLSSMTPRMSATHFPSSAALGQSMAPQHHPWDMHSGASGDPSADPAAAAPAVPYNISSHAFMLPNPGYVKREGEFDYDSQSESDTQSWHDAAGQHFQLSRSSPPGSEASNSVTGSPTPHHTLSDQPDSAPPNLSNFSISGSSYASSIAPPIRTDSPHSFQDLNLDADAAPAPPKMPSRKSSGFSRTNTGPIVTNMDRASATFLNEEGEETPIVRIGHVAQHSATGPARVPATTTQGGFLSAPQTRHRTTSLPETAENSGSNDAAMADSWNHRGHPATSFAPRQLPASFSTAPSMMPPPPRPPTLITSNLSTRFAWPNPSPIRSGLFATGNDLSGWLAEPVVPSPLCRMGSGLPSAITGNFSAFLQSPVTDTPISAKFSASLAQSMGLAADTQLDMSFLNPPQPPHGDSDFSATVTRTLSDPTSGGSARYDNDEQAVPLSPSLPSAKQWWIQPDQKGEVAASIAQASAAHFVSYPALMVLTDPAAPIPPFIHRKWLQDNRVNVPSSLANARSILAGYYVRLPASQSLIWSLIADQIRQNVSRLHELSQASTDALEVFGAVASLWMYLVLLVFTDEPACTQHIDAELLDNALLALSKLSEILLERALVAVQARRACSSNSSLSASEGFATFGWTETMIRTLFASYSLLVLQRFRENAGNARERLAGCGLILDLPLPAGAPEFEASSEQNWLNACTTVREEMSKVGGPQAELTLRQLVECRNKTRASEDRPEEAEAKLRNLPWTACLFDRQDEFTKVVLSVAFALDDTRI
ncbi:hypothetical protein BCV70DRAFT_210802 [Testicularia cyperi]|uniref:Zn(2)-C6 fungal-type domain-containing protein n=1 Tax=Testicularia cyperi TaxID=1882483 RepID=A0A317XU89_9BASI|nr:hypothetical protein BCV70DRAFT_210802 [Testicularia cyperi]